MPKFQTTLSAHLTLVILTFGFLLEIRNLILVIPMLHIGLGFSLFARRY